VVRKRLTWSILVSWLKRVRDSLLKPIVLVMTGQFSPTLATFVHQLKTRNPQTYVEKIRYKMAYDRRPILTLFADKLAVRSYVESRIGKNHLSKVYTVAPSYSELDWNRVPEEFVLKVNHGCRGVVVVTKNADLGASLPLPDKRKPWKMHIVHPLALDKELMGRWVDLWLKRSYNWRRWKYSEWAYSKVKRRVFIEEFLGGNQVLARNLKVLSFHGIAASVIVTRLGLNGREEAEGRFSPAELEFATNLSGVSLADLRTLVAHSELLSSETDFVRVDWILTPRGPIFGELTNYPAAGGTPAGPSLSMTATEVNQLYRDLWVLPRSYEELPQGRYPPAE